MRIGLPIFCALAFSACTGNAQETITLDEIADSAQQWVKENLDDDFLRVLGQADQRKARDFLEQLQRELHGEYIIDLAQLKETARTVLPLLESYEETLPYALWLKARLDYLDVADQLRVLIPAPKPKPGEQPKSALVPPVKVREIWIKKLAQRPWPESAKPYVSRLKPIFAAEQVPAELVWVAEVESSFDPRARSPAGATGLFQLMPATAKSYGLRTWPADQRLKPEPSARAAAQHLRHLHARYKDWRLALAAYNAGQGTVDTLLARHKARSFDAIASRLPAETQLYVPKVEATLLRREGTSLEKLAVLSPAPTH
jgi:membrane-bound lytic murein transglycosylase D